jgi:hypothetical protein
MGAPILVESPAARAEFNMIVGPDSGLLRGVYRTTTNKSRHEKSLAWVHSSPLSSTASMRLSSASSLPRAALKRTSHADTVLAST